ncbi:MAG TPA: hypothetical protein VJ820_10825, partial [Propionibacteriaceae bacterium]|nr:hypothetical protein [Propionibacteriaceae bacterium]
MRTLGLVFGENRAVGVHFVLPELSTDCSQRHGKPSQLGQSVLMPSRDIPEEFRDRPFPVAEARAAGMSRR